ncbi:MAG: ATP-binding cassette domain-containing protein [Acidobacteriota bacterium]
MAEPTMGTSIIAISRRLRLGLEEQPAAVKASGVSHDFGSAERPMPVLFDIDLHIDPGELVVLTGPSGSGKTTLLTLVGALRSVQRGSLTTLGRELRGLGRRDLVAVRRDLGFIFQAHNLFDSLTARQNVRLALELDDAEPREIDRRVEEILDQVGLGDRMEHKPEALSGGQRQRVAVARALARRPALVLADEPTAALDRTSGAQVMELISGLCKEQGTATLLVTHDTRVLGNADRIVNMVDGRIASDVHVRESLEICQFLTRVPLFANHTPGELAEIAEHVEHLDFGAGHVVFRQGDPGDRFYMVRQGSVRIVDEREGTDLALLGTGDFFGEVALVDDEPRNATAIVARDAELYTLGEREFEAALGRSRSLREQIVSMISTRR